MIVCICNGLRDTDVKSICDSCSSKDEFTECLKKRMKKESCHSCYCHLIEGFKKEKVNE